MHLFGLKPKPKLSQLEKKKWIQNCMDSWIAFHSRVKTSLKVVFATFLLVYFLSLNESTCQTKKNVFYFTSKALFVLKKIKF